MESRYDSQLDFSVGLAAKRRAADDEWGYTPHSGAGHCVHFRGLSEFIEVSELDRKLVNVIWPKYIYYGL